MGVKDNAISIFEEQRELTDEEMQAYKDMLHRKENGMGVIEKRTQAERLAIIESLLVGINSEIYEGKAETILQQAVNCQIEINRMVFELNRLREEGE